MLPHATRRLGDACFAGELELNELYGITGLIPECGQGGRLTTLGGDDLSATTSNELCHQRESDASARALNQSIHRLSNCGTAPSRTTALAVHATVRIQFPRTSLSTCCGLHDDDSLRCTGT